MEEEEKETHINSHPLIDSSLCEIYLYNFQLKQKIREYKLKPNNPIT